MEEVILLDFISKGMENVTPKLLSPLVLAYIGDAVYEMYIRLNLLPQIPKVHDLHQAVTKNVCASNQAKVLHALEQDLTEEERDIARRGRNAKSHVPKNADLFDYRYSTGFEALIGYLYLSGEIERLNYLLGRVTPTT